MVSAGDLEPVRNPLGLAYHRVLSDLVPGVVLLLVLATMLPLDLPDADDPLLPALLVSAAILALPAGLLVNFLSFTLFWPPIRWLEVRIDLGARARRLFEVDRLRRLFRQETGRDMDWAFVDRCENVVLSRHPERFGPYAHVEGLRKTMRSLALILPVAAALLLARRGFDGWAWLGAGGLLALAVGLVAYSAWLSGYYHAAMLNGVYLASLLDGKAEFRALVSDLKAEDAGAASDPSPTASRTPPRASTQAAAPSPEATSAAPPSRPAPRARRRRAP